MTAAKFALAANNSYKLECKKIIYMFYNTPDKEINMINKVDNNINFTGLKISPKFSKWDKDVLNATLNSKYIKDIIARDAQNGMDTYIKFDHKYKIGPIGGPNWDEMSLNIKGNGENIKLASCKTEVWDPAFHFFFSYPIITDLKNIENSLIKQIKKLDKTSQSNKTLTENYKEVKKLAGEIEFIDSKPTIKKTQPPKEKRGFWSLLMGEITW